MKWCIVGNRLCHGQVINLCNDLGYYAKSSTYCQYPTNMNEVTSKAWNLQITDFTFYPFNFNQKSLLESQNMNVSGFTIFRTICIVFQKLKLLLGSGFWSRKEKSRYKWKSSCRRNISNFFKFHRQSKFLQKHYWIFLTYILYIRESTCIPRYGCSWFYHIPKNIYIYIYTYIYCNYYIGKQ